MSDIVTVGVRAGAIVPISGNPRDQEWFDKNSLKTVFAFRNSAGSAPAFGANDGLVALAGGGQTGATALAANGAVVNRITTVVNSGDSVILPSALAGMVIMVANSGANPSNVFPATGEKINALAANSAFSLANGKNVIFFSPVAGQWYANLTA